MGEVGAKGGQARLDGGNTAGGSSDDLRVGGVQCREGRDPITRERRELGDDGGALGSE